jgi:hypothetical protein
MELMEFTSTLRDYFYDNNDIDLQVELDDYEISIYLDLPSTENYNNHINEVEKFFRYSNYDIEDFEIDGDYEGCITLIYEGE